ncbi:uncharacterized protein LY89DRAFT_718821 [Mollisia scopiformis]|uniref:Uncharacterized protein n=1 Tax=Mollisia scopiformis TaxID=149040 RepID=A0A194XAG5_MOLSC|nr:uncharacterized protein LY89DRAFT_718821 [Mollisia scopiformis]KUJ17161.1 hypothetical protein LY89DRAFT_718821 [Mollisia scopiformis]
MTSSSSEMVQPAAYGGYGRQTGLYGGLQGVEFAAKCPPDVQKNTRIIAVCGIPEIDAGPQDDGWFFSDFFLFYQMLGSRPELPNQLWFSSCSPSDLTRKHGRYLYGPANGVAGARRVVMNEAMLPEDEMKAGFRIVNPKDLLERFLATLKSEIQEAARAKQPVLVLIFGHGEEDTSGIFIGCGEGGLWKITQPRLTSMLQKAVQTTMILTSCFSGGWIMKPNFNKNFDKKPLFNHSFLTAAGAGTPSWSWGISETVGQQAGGSVFATCLLNSIITISDRKEGSIAKEKLIKVKEDDEGEELSMAGLTQQIVNECQAQCGTIWTEHEFSFAVQDDLWAQSCGKRTGLPLLNYEERWRSLPEAPVMRKVYKSAGPLNGSVMSKSPGALHRMVKVKAIRYMNSNPGRDNEGGNTNCHPRFHRLIEGAEFDIDQLYRLNEILDYREGQMRLAEFYCGILDIGVPEGWQGNKFEEYAWKLPYLKEKSEPSTDRSNSAIEVLEKFSMIRSWVFQLGIFDSPLPHQGFAYS